VTSCRNEILAAVQSILARNGGDTFTLGQVLREMGKRGADFREGTIRTHVTSRMCASSPDHHAKVYDDFERVGWGVYRMRQGTPGGAARDTHLEDLARPVGGTQVSGPAASLDIKGAQTSQNAPRGRVGLVGCVKAKLDHAAPAADLYVSTLFRGRRAYVERTCERWFILSALYGLVRPNVLLEPYDAALNKASRADRRTWATSVLSELDAELESCAALTFEIHAGASYVDYGLVDGLLARGAVVERPCVGLSMGQQLAFYAEPHAAGAAARPSPRTTAPQCRECDARDAIADLDESPTIVPACDWPAEIACLDQPGLYVWWVDDAGAADLSRGLGLAVAPGCIYAGQAGATFWPSGKNTDNTLGKRIGQLHLGGKVRGSTFRHTLAAILYEQLGVQVRASMRITPASEKALTAWMYGHLSVAVYSHEDRDTLSSLEHVMLQRLNPPLNLSHMSATPVRARLSELRRRINKQP